MTDLKIGDYRTDRGISGGRGCGREEFVPLDLCGYAYVAVYRGFHAHDLAATADVDLAGLGDELRQRKDEFDLGAYFELGFGHEIEALITDVASLRAEFVTTRFARKDP